MKAARATARGCAVRLLLAAPALALAGGFPAAATLEVRPGRAIQHAIDAAAAGDVIEVHHGRYAENLRVAKPLTLRGVGRPTVSGGQQGDTIRVASADVTIEGLIVRDSGDSLRDKNAGIHIQPGAHRAAVLRCDLAYNLFGIYIEKADDVRIERNLITGKRDYASPRRGNGVQLFASNGARIEGNDISFVRDALYVDLSHRAVFRGNRLHHSRYGTHYMNSYFNLWEDNDSWSNRGGIALMEVRDNVVRNNRAWNNVDHGIMLRTVQDSVVEGNVVAGSKRGFFVYDVEYTTLRGNLVIGNEVGVHLAAGSTRNLVDGNDFVGNRQPVRYIGSRDEPWGGDAGNHWSSYLGWDRDGDGRGDVPHEANDVVDRLTWRHPMTRILMSSPAVHALRVVARQFPVLRVPGVVESRPRMRARDFDRATWRRRLEGARDAR